MFDSEPPTLTPPLSPSTIDRGRESTAESTPISTPAISIASPRLGQQPRKERDTHISWRRRAFDYDQYRSRASEELDSDVLFPNQTGDDSFPLFPDSPPRRERFDMAPGASSINISTPPRFNSASPQNKTSVLTSQLQEAGVKAMPAPVNVGNSGDKSRLGVSRNDTFGSGMGSYTSGARPISMRDRRESTTNLGSLTGGGMSWGGVSVGSWIRDDIMTGTSPLMFTHSPSFHSSSYLPKMEAQYLTNYTCCGLDLENMHALLEHFETNHSQPSNHIASRPSQTGLAGMQMHNQTGNAFQQGHAVADAHGPQVQTGFQPTPHRNVNNLMNQSRQAEGFRSTPLSTVQDVDTLEDMEMDDVGIIPGPVAQPMPYQPQPQQPRFGTQPNQQIPQLNVNLANNMQQHQGLRTSTPTTPMAPNTGFPFNNPTVSSVNTPALSTHTLQQTQKTSPESSMPGTPAELNADAGMGGMGIADLSMMQDGGLNFAMDFMNNMNHGMMGMTIDEPAKRLIGKQGGFTVGQLQQAMKNGQLAGDGSNLAQQMIQQQLMGPGGFFEQEIKPFKCPVIGCEKAYKNQNGLKYHKQHGHNNQQLKDNGDGTFSIVDPETSIPYPGTIGMEKEKPYRCEVCGKRYKNLNGLKYHRGHSLPCNPEAKLNLPVGLHGLNVNVAGAGLASGPMDQMY